MSDKRDKVLDEQRHVSEKISDLCRYIGFGVVAVNYAVFTSDSPFSTQLVTEYTVPLLASVSIALLTILLDYLQFLSGYFMVRQALKNSDGDYKYDRESFFYQVKFKSFYAKQITVAISVLILLYIFISKLS